MNPKISFYGYLLVLIISACSKEPASTINKGLGPEPIPKHYIKTGEKDDSSIIYTSFEPALHIKGENLYEGEGYNYRDSLFLDVNQNGEYDLKVDFYSWYYEEDCPEDTISNDSIIVCCFPDAGRSYYVECLTEIEMLSFDSYWDRPLPLEDSVLLNDYNNTAQSLFNDEELKVGQAKSDEYYWSGKESSGILGFPGMNDSWDDSKLHYLGFRFPTSDTSATHGWINLSCKGENGIEIYDMAIEK